MDSPQGNPLEGVSPTSVEPGPLQPPVDKDSSDLMSKIPGVFWSESKHEWRRKFLDKTNKERIKSFSSSKWGFYEAKLLAETCEPPEGSFPIRRKIAPRSSLLSGAYLRDPFSSSTHAAPNSTVQDSISPPLVDAVLPHSEGRFIDVEEFCGSEAHEAPDFITMYENPSRPSYIFTKEAVSEGCQDSLQASVKEPSQKLRREDFKGFDYDVHPRQQPLEGSKGLLYDCLSFPGGMMMSSSTNTANSQAHTQGPPVEGYSTLGMTISGATSITNSRAHMKGPHVERYSALSHTRETASELSAGECGGAVEASCDEEGEDTDGQGKSSFFKLKRCGAGGECVDGGCSRGEGMCVGVVGSSSGTDITVNGRHFSFYPSAAVASIAHPPPSLCVEGWVGEKATDYALITASSAAASSSLCSDHKFDLLTGSSVCFPHDIYIGDPLSLPFFSSSSSRAAVSSELPLYNIPPTPPANSPGYYVGISDSAQTISEAAAHTLSGVVTPGVSAQGITGGGEKGVFLPLSAVDSVSEGFSGYPSYPTKLGDEKKLSFVPSNRNDAIRTADGGRSPPRQTIPVIKEKHLFSLSNLPMGASVKPIVSSQNAQKAVKGGGGGYGSNEGEAVMEGGGENEFADLQHRQQFEDLRALHTLQRPKDGRPKRVNVGAKPFSGVRGIYFQQGLWKVKYKGEHKTSVNLFPYKTAPEMKRQFFVARKFLSEVISKGRQLHDSDGEGLSNDEALWEGNPKIQKVKMNAAGGFQHAFQRPSKKHQGLPLAPKPPPQMVTEVLTRKNPPTSSPLPQKVSTPSSNVVHKKLIKPPAQSPHPQMLLQPSHTPPPSYPPCTPAEPPKQSLSIPKPTINVNLSCTHSQSTFFSNKKSRRKASSKKSNHSISSKHLKSSSQSNLDLKPGPTDYVFLPLLFLPSTFEECVRYGPRYEGSKDLLALPDEYIKRLMTLYPKDARSFLSTLDYITISRRKGGKLRGGVRGVNERRKSVNAGRRGGDQEDLHKDDGGPRSGSCDVGDGLLGLAGGEGVGGEKSNLLCALPQHGDEKPNFLCAPPHHVGDVKVKQEVQVPPQLGVEEEPKSAAKAGHLSPVGGEGGGGRIDAAKVTESSSSFHNEDDACPQQKDEVARRAQQHLPDILWRTNDNAGLGGGEGGLKGREMGGLGGVFAAKEGGTSFFSTPSDGVMQEYRLGSFGKETTGGFGTHTSKEEDSVQSIRCQSRPKESSGAARKTSNTVGCQASLEDSDLRERDNPNVRLVVSLMGHASDISTPLKIPPFAAEDRLLIAASGAPGVSTQEIIAETPLGASLGASSAASSKAIKKPPLLPPPQVSPASFYPPSPQLLPSSAISDAAPPLSAELQLGSQGDASLSLLKSARSSLEDTKSPPPCISCGGNVEGVVGGALSPLSGEDVKSAIGGAHPPSSGGRLEKAMEDSRPSTPGGDGNMSGSMEDSRPSRCEGNMKGAMEDSDPPPSHGDANLKKAMEETHPRNSPGDVNCKIEESHPPTSQEGDEKALVCDSLQSNDSLTLSEDDSSSSRPPEGESTLWRNPLYDISPSLLSSLRTMTSLDQLNMLEDRYMMFSDEPTLQRSMGRGDDMIPLDTLGFRSSSSDLPPPSNPLQNHPPLQNRCYQFGGERESSPRLNSHHPPEGGEGGGGSWSSASLSRLHFMKMMRRLECRLELSTYPFDFLCVTTNKKVVPPLVPLAATPSTTFASSPPSVMKSSASPEGSSIRSSVPPAPVVNGAFSQGVGDEGGEGGKLLNRHILRSRKQKEVDDWKQEEASGSCSSTPLRPAGGLRHSAERGDTRRWKRGSLGGVGERKSVG